MENLIASARRIMRNKNFVTIVGVILILILLYWGYSSQINNAVQPVTVPVAVSTIQPRTEITSSMVEMVDMPAISIGENVITSRNAVIGKYSNVNTVIPQGSMFYTDTVIDKEKLPDAVFVKVKKGQILYNFHVDIESTYGNSIMPGNKIDIYMKTGNGTEEKIMIGKLIENIEVLAIKDSSGRDVFENSTETRTPSMMMFGLPAKINLLLRKAEYLSSLGVELIPIPHGGTVESTGATEVSTQQLVDYIEAHSVDIPIEEETVNDTLLPVFSVAEKTITISYPEGCGSTYTCTYTEPSGKVTTVKSSSKSKKVSKTISFTEAGIFTATVTENDGTTHSATQEVTDVVNNTNSTDSANAANAAGTAGQ